MRAKRNFPNSILSSNQRERVHTNVFILYTVFDTIMLAKTMGINSQKPHSSLTCKIVNFIKVKFN